MFDPEKSFNKTVKAFHENRLRSAEKSYLALAKHLPRHADVLHLGGLIALKRGDHKNALRRLSARVEIGPSDGNIMSLVGVAQRNLGDIDGAIASQKTALSLSPDIPEILVRLANALTSKHLYAEALDYLQRAYSINPRADDLQFLLGVCLLETGDSRNAIGHFQNALDQEGNTPEIIFYLADALIRVDRTEDASDKIEQALEVAGDDVSALQRAGKLLFRCGEIEHAISILERALGIDPSDTLTHSHLANCLLRTGDFDRAEFFLRRRNEANPDEPETLYALGTLLVCRGNTEEGFGLLLRHSKQDRTRSSITSVPYWQAEPLSGKNLYAYGVQGVGDEVLFASFVPELTRRADKLTLQCDHRLIPILQRSFKDISIVPHPKPGVSEQDVNGADYVVALPDISPHLMADLVTRRAPDNAYLSPDLEKKAEIQKRYSRLTDNLKVGIAWRSGNKDRSERNAPLRAWEALLSIPSITFFNLQYGDTTDEIDAISNALGCEIFTDMEIDQFTNLDDFAAQIAALDRVVTISNTTLHIAGAIGARVDAIIPLHPDWRYRSESHETVWYPNVTLHRQTKNGDWDDVIKSVAATF